MVIIMCYSNTPITLNCTIWTSRYCQFLPLGGDTLHESWATLKQAFYLSLWYRYYAAYSALLCLVSVVVPVWVPCGVGWVAGYSLWIGTLKLKWNSHINMKIVFVLSNMIPWNIIQYNIMARISIIIIRLTLSISWQNMDIIKEKSPFKIIYISDSELNCNSLN